MTTAAESVPFNIVEGCGAESQKEFARFLEISIKSSSELEYQLQLAKDYGVLPDGEWSKLTRSTVDVRRMLCGLRRKVLGVDAEEPGPESDDDSTDNEQVTRNATTGNSKRATEWVES